MAQTPALDEALYLSRAMAAYFRQRKGQEAVADQPSSGLSGLQEYQGKYYVVLRNIRGTLAVYRVKNDGYLKGLKRWPKAFDEQ